MQWPQTNCHQVSNACAIHADSSRKIVPLDVLQAPRCTPLLSSMFGFRATQNSDDSGVAEACLGSVCSFESIGAANRMGCICFNLRCPWWSVVIEALFALLRQLDSIFYSIHILHRQILSCNCTSEAADGAVDADINGVHVVTVVEGVHNSMI